MNLLLDIFLLSSILFCCTALLKQVCLQNFRRHFIGDMICVSSADEHRPTENISNTHFTGLYETHQMLSAPYSIALVMEHHGTALCRAAGISVRWLK
jgi:hypothetical protein